MVFLVFSFCFVFKFGIKLFTFGLLNQLLNLCQYVLILTARFGHCIYTLYTLFLFCILFSIPLVIHGDCGTLRLFTLHFLNGIHRLYSLLD